MAPSGNEAAVDGIQAPTKAMTAEAKAWPTTRKPGEPCTDRMPVVGDFVFSNGGKKVGHDAEGRPKMWELLAGKVAQVLEVDDDGDIRLLNEQGIESGFLFRREFSFAVDEVPSNAKEARKEPEATVPVPEKPVAQAIDPGSQSEPFDVVIERANGQPLGLHLDTVSDDALEIVAITEGSIMLYNKTAAEKTVNEGDFIVSVNTKTGKKEEMVQEMQQKYDTMTLKVAPKLTFNATIDKMDKMGVALAFEPRCRSLIVNQVFDGAVSAYNQIVSKDQQIQICDRISEVNGTKGDPQKMLEMIKAEGAARLTLLVSRPCPQ